MVTAASSYVSEEEKHILEYLSESSDCDSETYFETHCHEVEPIVKFDNSFPETVVVINTPKVPHSKVERLTEVIQKATKDYFSRKGLQITKFSIELPLDENASTKGFCFMTFASSYDAKQAAKHLNGYTLDTNHRFKATLLDDVDEIINRSKSSEPPSQLLGLTREKFRWWLHDERCREQFVIRYSTETEIYWHDHIEHEAVLVYNGERERAVGRRVWTDYRVAWSPHGSYLVTFHRPGIALWANPDVSKQVRFEHNDVKQIEFSPNEEFILTWDGSPAKSRSDRAVCIWRVITGERIASFPTPAETPRGGDFPLFLWSHDDKYIAKMSEDSLSVYELPSMLLVSDEKNKRTPFKYPLKRFDWSPTDNILSIWIPETKDAPGRLLLIEVPSRRELACKNVYNVDDASMHWHSKGDYLALRTIVKKKTSKKGRKDITQLEIFRMRQKNIPVDVKRIENYKVKQFHWEEGYSKRFALVVEDDTSKQQSIHFYRVDAQVEHVETYQITDSINLMKWSPQGTNFLLVSSVEYVLLFCALNDNDKVEVLHKDEHLMVNDIRWSSCGRFVSTAVTVPMVQQSTNQGWRFSDNDGYIIWSYQGKIQYKSNKEKFYQFLWRPHPPLLLPDKKIEEIRKGLRDFSKKYDAIDDKLRASQRDAFYKARKIELDEFENELNALEKWKTQHEMYNYWMNGWHKFDAQFEWDETEEIHETELEAREEVIVEM